MAKAKAAAKGRLRAKARLRLRLHMRWLRIRLRRRQLRFKAEDGASTLNLVKSSLVTLVSSHSRLSSSHMV